MPRNAAASLGVGLLCGMIDGLLVWGRETYAVGGNEEAARFSGINVGATKLRVYAISGTLAGLVSLGTPVATLSRRVPRVDTRETRTPRSRRSTHDPKIGSAIAVERSAASSRPLCIAAKTGSIPGARPSL